MFQAPDSTVDKRLGNADKSASNDIEAKIDQMIYKAVWS